MTSMKIVLKEASLQSIHHASAISVAIISDTLVAGKNQIMTNVINLKEILQFR